MIDIKTLYFDDFEGFACRVADDYNSFDDKFSLVSVIAKFKEAKEIVKEFLCMGFDIATIDICREELDGYEDEYLITLDDGEIWCEKYKRENGYVFAQSTIAYISNDCNSSLIPHVKSDVMYAFEICDAYTDEDNSDERKCICCMDDLEDRKQNRLAIPLALADG